MAKDFIYLFMWGYQPHFRALLEHLSARVFETLGFKLKPKVLLVGTRRPESSNRNPVCIEPEDGQWPLDLFTDLLDSVEAIFKEHPEHLMFYSDERTMREKPERILRDSVRSAVIQALVPYDEEHSVRSFCGTPHPVDEYYVVPVIQVPERVFKQFPPLREPIGDGRIRGYQSFIHASIANLLEEANAELQRPDPGKSTGGRWRKAEEIVRNAASSFMKTPGVALGGQNFLFDLYETLNSISSLMYEGTKGTGRLALTNPSNPAIDYALRLKEPVPFHKPRWARKILQMASSEIALIADCEKIHGLGNIKADHDAGRQDVFLVDFLDHYHWQLRCGEQVLLRSHYAEPKLPQEPIDRELFLDNFSRIFPESTDKDQQRVWDLFNVAAQQKHGSMLVIATDAADESLRLARQGTSIEPTLLTERLLRRVSSIDGTIMLDPHCVCHAVGVILDGPANDACTPSRGSRYNSAVRYVRATEKPRMAIIASEDGTIDILPRLRPRVESSAIHEAIKALEQATLENYHQPKRWLDEHRFYLNSDQCKQVNTELDRIESLPMKEGQFIIKTNRFETHPDMNESYLL